MVEQPALDSTCPCSGASAGLRQNSAGLALSQGGSGEDGLCPERDLHLTWRSGTRQWDPQQSLGECLGHYSSQVPALGLVPTVLLERESLVVSPTSAVQQPFLRDPIPMIRTSSPARSQVMMVGGQGAQGRSPDTPRASDSVTLLVSGNVPVPNSGSPAEQQVGLGQTVPRKSKGEAGLGASQGCRGPWARGLEMKWGYSLRKLRLGGPGCRPCRQRGWSHRGRPLRPKF